MASGSWSWWGSSTTTGSAEFDRIVERCTSENLPSSTPPSIADSLELSDLLRSSGVPPSHALRSLRRRLVHPNPNVSLLAISVLDVCIKNGGDAFLREVASRDFSDEVAGLLRGPATNREVRDKLKREFQNWALAFEAVPSLKTSELVGQYHRLRHQGIEFPPRDPSATAAMVDSLSAPEWRDNDVCERCRTAFSFTNRKHHCRNCGGVFDNQCSTKRRLLPHFGITGERVRVCDGCDRLLAAGGGKQPPRRNSVADWPPSPSSPRTNGVARSSTFSTGSAKSSYHRHALSVPNRLSSREAADIERAIALSLQEPSTSRPGYNPGYVDGPSRPPDPPISGKNDKIEEEYDPDLAAAIAASLREVEAPRPSAPVSAAGGTDAKVPPKRPPLPSYDLSPAETDALLSFAGDLESAQLAGRLDPRDRMAVARFDALHDRALAARQQLLRGLGDADRKTQLLQEMNDKVSQAVKLYDRLLEEQLAHRTAYSSQPAPSLYSAFAPAASSASYAQPGPYAYSRQPVSNGPSAYVHSPMPPEAYPSSPTVGTNAAYPTSPAIGTHSYSAYSTSPRPDPAAYQTLPPAPEAAPQPPYQHPVYAEQPPPPQPLYSAAPPPPPQAQYYPEHHQAPAPVTEEPSYYKTPYVHYTADSFPVAPQAEPQAQHAEANPWAANAAGGYRTSLERREEVAAPLIEL